MDIQSLLLRLQKIYTRDRLGTITRGLIDLYRKREFHSLLKVQSHLAKPPLSHPSTKEPGKIFSSLIRLYHPDTFSRSWERIEEAGEKGNHDALSGFLQIIEVHIPSTGPSSSEIQSETRKTYEPHTEYTPRDYDWRYGEEDFDEVRSHDVYEENYVYDEPGPEEDDSVRDFYSAMKSYDPGLKTVVLTESLLASIDGGIDLSDYEIEDLSGLRFCVHLESLNISGNHLTDVREISTLTSLKELLLSENYIDDIEPLRGLKELRELDLSFNEIPDISPLLDLPALEYVNLVGNPLKNEDVEGLLAKGVIAIF